MRELLLEEGVAFEGGKARPEQRIRPAEGVAAETAAREAATARRAEERARRQTEGVLAPGEKEPECPSAA